MRQSAGEINQASMDEKLDLEYRRVETTRMALIFRCYVYAIEKIRKIKAPFDNPVTLCGDLNGTKANYFKPKG